MWKEAVASAYVLLLAGGAAMAQTAEKDPVAVLELGAEPTQSLRGGGFDLSPTIAAEVTPIEDWLELEGGVTPTFHAHSTEWETDLLFKKPWTLSKTAEVMAGAGPTWVHATGQGQVHDAVGGEAALDFMFWPGGGHRFGWYLEPAYDYVFVRDHDSSVSLSVGLLVAIP